MTTIGVLWGPDRTRSGQPVPRVKWNLTETDRLWAARMLVGEEGRDVTFEQGRVILSVMLRRMAIVTADHRRRGLPVRFPTFVSFIRGTATRPRGYSQPISIYWQNRGSQARQDRRARIRSLAWPNIPENARRAADAVLTGRAKLWGAGTGAEEFADAPTSRSFMERNPGSYRVAAPTVNWMISTRLGRAYPDPYVEGVRRCALFDSLARARLERRPAPSSPRTAKGK